MIHQQHNKPTVLVTGASSGIGQATARLFAEEGFRVFGTSRRMRVQEWGVEMVEMDVRSSDSVERCTAELLARAGPIDVLINNAGVMHQGIAEETTMEDARAVFETNFFGVVRLTNSMLPLMRARRQGRIINVGSLAAWVGEPAEAFYSASKSALARYTEALRHEVWCLGIHVSLVEPGAFQTNVLRAASENRTPIGDYNAVREAARRTVREGLRKGGDPRTVARLILKVATARSPRLRYGAGLEAVCLPYFKLMMPQRLFDALLRKGYGLSKAAKRPRWP
jgi:NAD(P)-dependent dehydrogenase (short-subunit alcohol dehydrogenase family)